jgi:hypothetical protein
MAETNEEQPKKPTIDERLRALTRNLQLDIAAREAREARDRKLDARERKARTALLNGIRAYCEVLKEAGEDETGSADATRDT